MIVKQLYRIERILGTSVYNMWENQNCHHIVLLPSLTWWSWQPVTFDLSAFRATWFSRATTWSRLSQSWPSCQTRYTMSMSVKTGVYMSFVCVSHLRGYEKEFWNYFFTLFPLSVSGLQFPEAKRASLTSPLGRSTGWSRLRMDTWLWWDIPWLVRFRWCSTRDKKWAAFKNGAARN